MQRPRKNISGVNSKSRVYDDLKVFKHCLVLKYFELQFILSFGLKQACHLLRNITTTIF